MAQRLAVTLLCCLLASPAAAVTMKLQWSSKPKPGVEVRRYGTTSPTTRMWSAHIDLCAAHVHMDATKPPTALVSTGKWGAKVGALLAVNGDFYKTGPVRIYGQAVGLGTAWPAKQNGIWSGYSYEWFYNNHGWIGFQHDDVRFSHTEHSKKNAAKLNLKKGWSPTKVTHNLPVGLLGLVSGFPELVIEGKQVTCSSPKAKDCFPDRGDFKARHPRTAMGLTADRKTFILVVVDGRTSKSKGMYGTELAEVMKKLGAWEAFNLDGGGSSQMWLAGSGNLSGYLNDYSGNNMGKGARSVANHWGLLVTDRPKRPGHCVGNKPCAIIGPAGGTVDNSSPCFVPYGLMKYWRTEKGGIGGDLRWTNASSGSVPGNWAWWRLHLAEAGDYLVEYSAVAKWAVHKKARYVIRHGNVTKTLLVDQSKGGTWRKLGTMKFAAGAAQWVAIYDNNGGSVAKNQHIIADAIRLTRVGPWCGNKKCDGGESCKTCKKDCGACISCGDGKCNGAETCSTCKKDCGACPPKCGDGDCNGSETCGSCAKDCGACPQPDAGKVDVDAPDTGAADVGKPDTGIPDTLDAGRPWLPDVGSASDAGDDVADSAANDAADAAGAGFDVHENGHDAAVVVADGGVSDVRTVGGHVSSSASGCGAGPRGAIPPWWLLFWLVVVAAGAAIGRRNSARDGRA